MISVSSRCSALDSITLNLPRGCTAIEVSYCSLYFITYDSLSVRMLMMSMMSIMMTMMVQMRMCMNNRPSSAMTVVTVEHVVVMRMRM